MNRLEDKFKDAFDHFEPEVDPSVWAKISAELPSSPASLNDGGSSAAVKGIVAKLGVKGIAVLITAAAITLSALYYFTGQKEDSRPDGLQVESPVTIEQSAPDVPVAAEPSAGDLNISEQVPASSSSEAISGGTAPVTTNENTSGIVAPTVAVPNASTGSNKTDNGESAYQQKSPGSATVSAPVSTLVQQAGSSIPAPEQAVINNKISPVLIVSSVSGFAPFTVTAMTNQQGCKADFDFGDGSAKADQLSATHSYQEPGEYTLTCTVDGITLRKTITVIGKIPTAFSPNGDGLNDRFELENSAGIQLEIRIFTRNGKLVYSGKGVEISWDGLLPDGRQAEAGTYLYDIFANSGVESPIKQKGTLHLFK
jgi:gliding motility-associated-like protein